MAHARPKDLADLSELLARIRTLPGLKETQTGIFYRSGKGFLHFHTRQGERWADIREGPNWGEPVPLPFGADSQAQVAFLAVVRERLARPL
ncbi:MAG: hypothetical protein IGS03_08140 [Candidatus Sericytochromatia bacterium]|nr:hypothetical protein [Candidatus Sericytochromatia bacterium]